ncbi:MAG: UDP-N-acetylmuramoyl-L-alanine--D-glutamate ligase [Clostridia bacterium]|nr:UDP-N-acetylmuramoyl-L-alanine--D-glutamate ligase [Clostridia bacterium]
MRESIYYGTHTRRHFASEGAEPSPWAGKKVLIVGMARSGVALAQLLCREGAMVTVNDMKDADAFGDKLDVLKEQPVCFRLGEDGIDALQGKDMLIISPGVPIDAPIVKAAKATGIPVSGELEIASRIAKGTLVAVTGTNGKTTTVSLLGAIFREAGKIAYVAGNIGYPLSAAAMESKYNDVLVAEVSSFQLETTDTFHPLTAAVLNVTEDHLNRHGTMEVYTALKRHIFDAQDEKDFAVLNYEDEACRKMAEGLKSRVLFFSRLHEVDQGAFVRDGQIVIRIGGEEKTICNADEIYIPGPHNLENALAAAAIAFSRGVPGPVIRHALRTFKGVEHRIEFVRELDGVRYINDSKGTNVDSTIKAVQSMKAPTAIILGGYDKHVSFAPLAEEIAKTPLIENCVIIGATGDQIEQALKTVGYEHIHRADTLEDAVNRCRALSQIGGNVLLSPACASFDMFSDYEQRGRIFKDIVNRLK